MSGKIRVQRTQPANRADAVVAANEVQSSATHVQQPEDPLILELPSVGLQGRESRIALSLCQHGGECSNAYVAADFEGISSRNALLAQIRVQGRYHFVFNIPR